MILHIIYKKLKRQFIELIAFSSQSYLYLGAILQLPYEQGTLPRLMIDLAIQSAIWSGRLGSMSDNERLELLMASAQSYIGWALIDAPLEAQSTQFVHQLMHKLQLPEDALSQFRNFVTRALMDLGGVVGPSRRMGLLMRSLARLSPKRLPQDTYCMDWESVSRRILFSPLSLGSMCLIAWSRRNQTH